MVQDPFAGADAYMNGEAEMEHCKLGRVDATA